jgi:probable phosphoglycerate mutase
MTERVVAALRDASDEAGVGGTAVVVMHGGSARVGVGGLLGWPQETWYTLGVLGNCRVTELRLSPEQGWRLESHNV